MEQGTITAEIDIAAVPERIFQALTDPEQLKTWWGSEDTYRADTWMVDLRVGGKWRCDGENVRGMNYSVEGEFLEIEPPKVLSYTWNPSWEKIPTTTVRYRLTPTANGTRVQVVHQGFTGYESVRKDHEAHYPLILNWLKEHTENPA